MKRLLYLLVVSPIVVAAQTTPTNIFITNTVADQIIRGNYNPNDYAPSTVITNPNSIVCHVESETSSDSLFAFLEKLSSFHTRHTYSDTVSSDTGIGAARRWIHSKFEQFSQRNENRLVTSYMQFDIDASGQCGSGTFRNTFAVLPGRDAGDPSFILIEGHADSRCEERCDIDCLAHGADDNGSGTVMVMELARVMSKLSFDHTIVFMATVGEEQGLYGAHAFAKYCQDSGIAVKAVQNNDIVGGVLCGHTASPPGCSEFMTIDSTQIRIFSFGTANSDHKGYARFVKMTYEENLLPIVSVPMAVSVMAPEDRTGRGGDHIPFRQRSFTAIRFTSANEFGHGAPDSNYLDHQHTSKDIIGYDTDSNGVIDSFLVDFNYLRRNSVINGVAAALAANGPDQVTFSIGQASGKYTVTITDPNSYQHYRIGVRTTTSNDFSAVYTVKNATTFDIPNIQSGTMTRVSVAAVDGRGVMGLFAKEQSQSATSNTSNPGADTLQFRAMNCWPEGIESHDEKESPENISMRVAPNPLENEAYILIQLPESFRSGQARIEILDATGRQIHLRRMTLTSGRQIPERLSAEQWPSAIYWVALFVDDIPVANEKITVIHRH